LYILSTITFGAPAGAKMPHQLLASYPGTPASEIVGALGKSLLRADPPKSSTLSFPDVI
jgi:hypothetical protein